MASTEVVIVSAQRTPIGAFLGVLAPLTAPYSSAPPPSRAASPRPASTGRP